MIKIKRIENRTLFDVVVALAADYERRKQAVIEKTVSKRVRMEYIYINSRLFSAAAEIAGASFAEEFISDIGDRIGYAKSSLEMFSEGMYKKYKQEIKLNMAVKLNLIDRETVFGYGE